MMTSTEEKTRQMEETVADYVKNWRFSIEDDKYFHLDGRTSKGYTKDKMKQQIRLDFPRESGNNQREILDRIQNVEGKRNVYGGAPFVSEHNQIFMNTYKKSEVMKLAEYGNQDLTPKKEYIDLYTDLLESMHKTDEGIDVTLAHANITIFHPDKMARRMIVYRTKETEVGKTLQCRIVAAILGRTNYSFIGQKDLEGNYNPYIKHRLVVANDIGKWRSATQNNDLKSAITEQSVSCREKYIGERDINNHSCWIMTTNEWANLDILEDKRRVVMIDLNERKFDRTKGAQIDELVSNNDTDFLLAAYMVIRDRVAKPLEVLHADHNFDNQREVKDDLTPISVEITAQRIRDRYPRFISKKNLNELLIELQQDRVLKSIPYGFKRAVREYLGATESSDKHSVRGWKIPQDVDNTANGVNYKEQEFEFRG